MLCFSYLGSVGEVLAVDVLADEPPQRLDVVHRRPQRVHLARLKGRQKCYVREVTSHVKKGSVLSVLTAYLVLQVRDVVAQRGEAAVDLLHPVPLPGIPARHRGSLQRQNQNGR